MKYIILFLLSSTFCFAQASDDSVLSYVICKNGTIVRTIRVEWLESEKVCVSIYTKNGQDKEVGRAHNKPFCNTFLENIKGNLTKAGWTCRDVSKNVDLHSSR